jgi:hypothetical protein
MVVHLFLGGGLLLEVIPEIGVRFRGFVEPQVYIAAKQPRRVLGLGRLLDVFGKVLQRPLEVIQLHPKSPAPVPPIRFVSTRRGHGLVQVGQRVLQAPLRSRSLPRKK